MFASRWLALPVSLWMGLLLVASFAAADEDLAEKKVELKTGDRILFFGDSLTELAGRKVSRVLIGLGLFTGLLLRPGAVRPQKLDATAREVV
jgi:hypothetical protein